MPGTWSVPTVAEQIVGAGRVVSAAVSEDEVGRRGGLPRRSGGRGSGSMRGSAFRSRVAVGSLVLVLVAVLVIPAGLASGAGAQEPPPADATDVPAKGPLSY